ncbi:MAG: hypothetical protein A2086_04010 [Spirochaetes bacterium GWD1_27_9]|nr:MAG: hypothetical protein A2Z98_03160 [Spirochaetes bacterium GWB1_27_13]OHD24515.1 MAG: hypothetical protein A2Y34_03535 [Spirochaetes bacterium GWC1_27_15]OHD45139.1 MAG: hypothetical protein A2086_04010 [Spirochaetes bacterium GWD1_27_9]
MEKKLNCWEFKKCGREPNVNKVNELGVCPASVENKINGLHSGVNGGRCCWVIAGTFCGGKVQGVYAEKLGNCINCEFYKLVWKEEGKKNIKMSVQILDMLK